MLTTGNCFSKSSENRVLSGFPFSSLQKSLKVMGKNYSILKLNKGHKKTAVRHKGKIISYAVYSDLQ